MKLINQIVKFIDKWLPTVLYLLVMTIITFLLIGLNVRVIEWVINLVGGLL